MNTKHWHLAIWLVFATPIIDLAHAEDPLEGIKYPMIVSETKARESDRPRLVVVGGELKFVESHYQAAGKPDDRGLPSLKLGSGEMQDRLLKDGAMLRVDLTDKSYQSKAQRAKDGWYMTGDYKSSPPQVILTKEPTKNSRWTFNRELIDRGRKEVFYIKNENDMGKDAWLSVGKDGVRYKEGLETYKPILSFEHRQAFFVEDYQDGR